MVAEIPDGHTGRHRTIGELRRCSGQEDLAAVRGRADPRGAVDIESDVATGDQGGVAGVQTHPDLDRHAARPPVPAQGALAVGRGGDPRGRRPKHDEERVSLGPDLDAAVSRKGPAQAPTVVL
jgi:hypothetical protein